MRIEYTNFYEDTRKDAHKLLDSVIDTIIAKNTDYGDSFSITGKVGASTRIFDKAMRLYTLSVNSNEPQVKDEAIEDTARDLFAYALMFMLKFGEKTVPCPSVVWTAQAEEAKQKEFCIAWGGTASRVMTVFIDAWNNTEDMEAPYDGGLAFWKLLDGYVAPAFMYGLLDGMLKSKSIKSWEKVE